MLCFAVSISIGADLASLIPQVEVRQIVLAHYAVHTIEVWVLSRTILDFGVLFLIIVILLFPLIVWIASVYEIWAFQAGLVCVGRGLVQTTVHVDIKRFRAFTLLAFIVIIVIIFALRAGEAGGAIIVGPIFRTFP